MRLFHSKRFEYEWTDVHFDLEGHRLLTDTKEEQAEMVKKEKEMLEKWDRERSFFSSFCITTSHHFSCPLDALTTLSLLSAPSSSLVPSLAPRLFPTSLRTWCSP